MKRLFYSLMMVSFLGMLTVGFTGCTDDDPVSPGEVDVERPTNLKAYSDERSVGLSWSPSDSETDAAFAGYTVKYLEAGTTDTMLHTDGPGNGTIVSNLTNGVRYEFLVFGRTTSGNISASYAKILWSAAARQTSDIDNNVIKVYSTWSTNNSAIDIYNDAGKAEVIPQADVGDNPFITRGDLYVTSPLVDDAFLEIKSPDLANNKGLVTEFSSANPIAINNLNEYGQTTPPIASSYSLKSLTISANATQDGAMYFGRIKRGAGTYFYFRMLILRGQDGSLVQGTGADRYVELEFSYQSTAGNQFAK
mgnify:CR=1 FL=1